MNSNLQEIGIPFLRVLEHSDNVTGFGNHSVTDRQSIVSLTGTAKRRRRAQVYCHRPATLKRHSPAKPKCLKISLRAYLF